MVGRRRARPTGDEGSSVIEFLGLSLVLLVPLVYLVLTLGRLEAATFATEGAAREAARTYVAADGADEGAERAVAAVGIALRDQGFDDDPADGADAHLLGGAVPGTRQRRVRADRGAACRCRSCRASSATSSRWRSRSAPSVSRRSTPTGRPMSSASGPSRARIAAAATTGR